MIGIFLAAHGNHIADLEVATLGRLAIFAKFGLRRDVDGHRLAIRIGNLQRGIMNRSDLAEQGHALLVALGALSFLRMGVLL